MGEAEELEREDVERRGAVEALVGIRWRPALLFVIEELEEVALEGVRWVDWPYCCCWGGIVVIDGAPLGGLAMDPARDPASAAYPPCCWRLLYDGRPGTGFRSG